ncbi:hypothetical protein BDV93DRAFT_522424 [Ceratobasidium sp. AG-I]|nr:hypothetical protein BDV93DRAFT_522424 [Ceratobasidium sp. AG-I]
MRSILLITAVAFLATQVAALPQTPPLTCADIFCIATHTCVCNPTCSCQPCCGNPP